MKPDHASVNWHEDRAEEVAAALFSAGIAVHAGLWLGTDGAERFQASPLRGRVGRVLAEVLQPVLRLARTHGFDARIGLEDTLVVPDGSPAPDNAALVRAALAIPARSP